MSLNRRDLLTGLTKMGAAAAFGRSLAAGGATPDAGAAAQESHSHILALAPRALLLDGEPRFLICGTIDYFRCPAEHWGDVLLRAKRSGLNSIMTCIAWNWHECEEGVFDFSGDADLGRFFDLCADLGLLAFPRLGPFVCDDWEAGGHPAWLYAKPGVELRIQNDVALTYVRRWFEKVVPIIAQRQATRGGPVVFVQQENEYYHEGRPGVQSYQRSLITMMREFGIEVPITDCNGDSPNVRIAESFMTQNGGGASAIAKARKVHPQQLALSSELYTGWGTCWDWPVSSFPSAQAMQQQVFETLAAGGMYSYFMTYGGTNFGFMASTSWKSDQAYVTTRYYPRSPVGEGGALSELFFPSKAVNQLGLTFERDLALGEDAPLPVSFSGPVKGGAVRVPRGMLLFVQPRHPRRDEMVYHTDHTGPLTQLAEDWPYAELAAQPGAIRLPSGEVLELAERSETPSLLPWQLRLDPDLLIDYSNATLFGVAGQRGARALLLRGESGRHGVISLNGAVNEWVFSGRAPVVMRLGKVTLIAVAGLTADRSWLVDGRAVIGLAYVGARQGRGHECYLDGDVTDILSIEADGSLQTRRAGPAAVPSAKIALHGFTARSLTEPRTGRVGWRELPQPRPVEELGAYYGYSWYRARCVADRARSSGLLFTAAADRVTVFVNGKRSGIWGAGNGAVRDRLPVDLVAGSNELVFLVDNMGRLSEGARVEHKGIWGPAYLDATVVSVTAAAVQAASGGAPTQSWTYQTYAQFQNGAPQFFKVNYRVPTRVGAGLQLALRWFPQYAWIMIHGRAVAEHSGDVSVANGVDFSTFTLDSYVTGRELDIEIVFAGEPSRDFAAQVAFLTYPKANALTDWEFKPWTTPGGTAPALPGEPVLWQTRFDLPVVPGPWLLATDGLSKGQAYVNGRALGRYWDTVGPQHSLYVPQAWLKSTGNELALFDEHGHVPAEVYLLRDARVPTEFVIA